MQTVLRLAPTYALLGVPTGVVARSFPSYLLVDEVKILPKGVTGKQALFDLIMQQTEEAFTIDDFVFGLPKSVSHENKNTEVTLYPKPATGFTGKITFYYNRRPLSDLFLPPEIVVTDEVTSYDFIGDIVAATGVTVGEEDLEETLVQETSLTLIAGPSSYFFIPGTSQTVLK